jgi:outer membrane protein TolC/anti-anti-sigma regulatory factor
MEARVFKKEKSIVLELSGRVDSFHAPLIDTEIKSYVSSGKSRIAIDLTAVTHLDPLCLRGWVFHHFELIKQGKGGGIGLIGPKGGIQELIESSNLRSIMPILLSVEEVNSVVFPKLKDQVESENLIGCIFSNFMKFLRSVIQLVLFIFFLGTVCRSQSAFSAEDFSLTLRQSQIYAREKSPLIRLARARLTEKDATYEVARKSPLPKLSSTLGYLYQSNPNALSEIVNKEANSIRSGNTSEGVNEMQTRNQVKFDKNVFVVGIGALQVIYAGGFFDAKQALADREKELSEIEVSLSEQEVDSLVRDAFIGIILLERKSALEKTRVEVSLRRKEAMAMALETQAVPRMLADEADIALLGAERELENTQAELSDLREKFNMLLGREKGLDFRLVFSQAELESAEALKVSPSFDAALARNPLMAQALKRISMSESYITLMRSQEMFVPKVFTFGGVDHTKGIGSDARFLNWTAGLGVVIPLIDGGVQNEETRKALALRTQAELSYQIDEGKLRQSVESAMRKIKHSKRDWEMAKKAVAIVSRGLKEAEDAAKTKQIPQYQLEEVRLKSIEADLKLLATETERLRWDSVLKGLLGSQNETN